jgi:hypothetical protein
MEIKYKIVAFHQQTGSVQVEYFNENLPEGVVFSINLPLVDGEYPQGKALEEFIQSYAPHDIFERAGMLREQAPASPFDASIPHIQAESTGQPTEPQLFGEGQMFIREGAERILLNRPLVQLNAIDVPVEII